MFEDSESALERVVYEDLLDGVEHTPGPLLGRGVDFERWHSEETYHVVRLDLCLLSDDFSTVPDDELLSCRDALREQVSDLDDDALPRAVRDCIQAA
jgi:hypothetical protein